MPSRIFCVDLSDGARDFQHTATEPGLPMLDASGANYAVMRQWLGELVAEPNWEDATKVGFHIRREGARLDRCHVVPVTAADLEKGLNEDWEALQTKLRKARPDTTSEQSLHRVATKTIRTIANDPEANDFDCFLFKYRQGKEPWRLVWCWGYQRIDQQPAKGVICRDVECNHLFAQRQGQRAICPACQKVATRSGGDGFFAGAGGRWTAFALGAAIVLLLALLFFGSGKITVSPDRWAGPVGGKPEFKVQLQKYFFFQTDITDQVLAISHDRRIVEAQTASDVKAVGPGKTMLTFMHGDRARLVPLTVNAVKPAASLVLKPDKVKLGVGTTAQFQVLAKSADGQEYELTDKIAWSFSVADVASVNGGLVEGMKPGKTVLKVTHQGDAFSEELEATAEIEVADIEFKSLRVALSPSALKRAQQARITTDAIAVDGEAYSLAQSSLLSLQVEPPERARLNDGKLLALDAGEGKVAAAFRKLAGAAAFKVANESLLPSGTFQVTPDEVTLSVYEYFKLNIVTDDPKAVKVTSANPSIVEALDDEFLVGASPGDTIVTVTRGDKSKDIKVHVRGGQLAEVWFESDRIVMRPGQRKLLRIYARTASGRKIEIAPSRLKWEAQPVAEYVEFNRDSMYLVAKKPTPRAQRLIASTDGQIAANATVEVVGDGLAVVEVDEGFGTYPPIPLLDINAGRFVGRGIVFRGSDLIIDEKLGADHILIKSGLTPGTRILGVNGVSFDGWDQERIRKYFLDNPLALNDSLMIRRADGTLGRVSLGESGALVQPVEIVGATYHAQNEKIYAKVRLKVTQAGQYRVIVPGAEKAAAWVDLGVGVSDVIATETFEKPQDKEFLLIVERKIGDVVKRFQRNLAVPADSDIK